MKIYDKEKKNILEEYDLEKGYLKDDELIIHHPEIKEEEEEGHFETIKEYKNGGKDVVWIVDKPKIEHVDAYDEKEQIQVFIEYTEEELKIREKEKLIEEKFKEMDILKSVLSKTDYKALKFLEGWYTEEEYEPIKNEREQIRRQIRKIEQELSEIQKGE